MSKVYIEYLRHILLECEYISSVISPDITKDEFLRDETLKRAVVRSLEIIGEATKNEFIFRGTLSKLIGKTFNSFFPRNDFC